MSFNNDELISPDWINSNFLKSVLEYSGKLNNVTLHEKSFNHDELQPPQWINSDYLKLVLESNGELQNVSVHDYEVTPATTVGDHFASIMFRITITYTADSSQRTKRSVIIKTLPIVEGFKKDMLANTGIDFFANEIFMYTNVLDDCQKILRTAGYKDLLAPKMIYNSVEPQKVIAFEDLKELGYFMFPKSLPNEDEADLIFSKLAQFHAATYKMFEEGRKDLQVKGSVFNLSNVYEMEFFSNSISHLLELVETLDGFEVIAEKLRKITCRQLISKCIESVNKPGLYNVLNHGDYHIRNMMFKGNSEKDISQIALVDFQICHWGSPAFDIYYMSAVIPREMRKRVYEVYFNTFIDVLIKTEFGGTLPTYEQFQEELKSGEHLDLFFLASLTCFLCMDKSEIKSEMEEYLQNSDLMKVCYKTPRYIEFIKGSLPFLLENGVLDNV